MAFRKLQVLSLGRSPRLNTSNAFGLLLTCCTDGGGVRGLSALHILRRLLCLVNEQLGGPTEPMQPQEIFDIVVGTSTGG